MSLETPNRSHASGTFVPVLAPPFDDAIVNSNGVKGFTRNGPGNYTVELTRALAFAEGIAEAELPANFLGICGAQIAPDGLTVLVTVFNLQGAPADPPIISFKVTSVEEGEGDGPQPALPAAPVPAGIRALGWAHVDADGTILAQTGAVLSVLRSAEGLYNYVLNDGLSAIAALNAMVDIGNGSNGQQGIPNGQITGATTADLNMITHAGLAADRAHWMFFYSL